MDRSIGSLASRLYITKKGVNLVDLFDKRIKHHQHPNHPVGHLPISGVMPLGFGLVAHQAHSTVDDALVTLCLNPVNASNLSIIWLQNSFPYTKGNAVG